MTQRRLLFCCCLWMAQLLVLVLATNNSQAKGTNNAVEAAPCPGGGEAHFALTEEEEGEGGGGRGWPVEVKRVGFNAWGGKRLNAGGEWVKGQQQRTSDQEEEKRVGFNAWGGKRNQFSAWGGKRNRAFFPWGGKRDSPTEDESDEDQERGMEWGSIGQPEETMGSREGGETESWGRPFGRGRRSPSSTRSQLTATLGDPMLSDAGMWERKKLAALWRTAQLQPARQNRRVMGADFFPWGGKRALAA